MLTTHSSDADDKVIQHNGAGSVTIDGFTVENFGKLYRSCGNCKQNGDARKVTISNVQATDGKYLVGINSNYGDTATITGTCAVSPPHPPLSQCKNKTANP